MSNPVLQFQINSKAPDETAKFYGELFGWRIGADNPLGYRTIRTGSDTGIHGGIWPAPPHAANFVQLFVGVKDVGAVLEQAARLGAKVIIPVTKLPGGDEMAVLLDPHGMPVGLMKAAAA
jgi:predicted enzyme related to lactoylglutathione lyase